MSENKRVVTVRGGLHSFLYEIGRITKTFGAHYTVNFADRVILHHKCKWYVVWSTPRNSYTVCSNDGRRLVVFKDSMYLDGEKIDIITAPGMEEFTASEVYDSVEKAIEDYWEYQQNPRAFLRRICVPEGVCPSQSYTH